MISFARRRGRLLGIMGVVFALVLVAALVVVPQLLASGGNGCGNGP